MPSPAAVIMSEIDQALRVHLALEARAMAPAA